MYSWFSFYLSSCFYQSISGSFSVITILKMLELQGSISELPFIYTLAALTTSSSPMSEI